MKKLIVGILTVMCLFTLTACGGTPSASDAGSDKGSGSNKESNYPEKSLNFLVPTGAGGGLDTTTRSMVKVLSETKLVTQAATVENKPGGGQVVGTVEFANKEKGNDYKLMVTSTPFLLNHLKKEGNSPVSFRDITPLARLVTEHDVLAVSTDSKYQDLKALYADLKADPTSITFAGGSGPGAFDHLNVIYPAMEAGINPKEIKYVSYDGGGEALTAVLGGNADVISSDLSSVFEYVKAGKLRILGVSSPDRLSGEFKDIPTYKEQGIDAELTNWRGIFGPAEMSEEAKAYWEKQIDSLAKTKEWSAELEKQDYVGNMMFNTLGNIVENTKTGLLFIDFQKGHTLQLTGDSEIIWDLTDEEKLKYKGAKRLIKYVISGVTEKQNANMYLWDFLSYSPFNPK